VFRGWGEALSTLVIWLAYIQVEQSYIDNARDGRGGGDDEIAFGGRVRGKLVVFPEGGAQGG